MSGQQYQNNLVELVSCRDFGDSGEFWVLQWAIPGQLQLASLKFSKSQVKDDRLRKALADMHGDKRGSRRVLSVQWRAADFSRKNARTGPLLRGRIAVIKYVSAFL